MIKHFLAMMAIVLKYSRKEFFIRIFTTVLYAAVPPVVTLLLGQITQALTKKNAGELVVFLGSFLVVTLVWGYYARFANIVNARLDAKVLFKLREYMADILAGVPLDQIDNPKFMKERERADTFLNTYALRYLSASERLVVIVLTLFNYCLLFFAVNPLFIVIVIAASVPGFLSRAKFVTEMRQMYEDLQEERSLQGYYYNSLTNKDVLKELRIWQLENTFYNQYRTLTDNILKKQSRHYYRHGFVGGGIESLFFSLGIAATLFWGMSLLHASLITISGFVIVLNSVSDIQDTFISAFYNILSFKESSFYARDFIEVQKAAFQMQDDGAPHKLEDHSAYIEVQGIHFAYPNSSREALADVSLQLERGEKVALVGENGSGKTTFCKVLSGVYSPKAGAVYLEGKKLVQGASGQNGFVSITFQDFCKYHLTIGENVYLGNMREQNNNGLILQSMRWSGFYEVLQQTGACLDTELGTVSGKGVSLSGGEWQKLAVARCFFNDKDMIILDEPHAALDPISEEKMYQYYRQLIGYEDKTILFVTHRLTSAKICDRILVFRDGTIVEDGSHQELMNRRGQYYDMYSKQLQHYK